MRHNKKDRHQTTSAAPRGTFPSIVIQTSRYGAHASHRMREHPSQRNTADQSLPRPLGGTVGNEDKTHIRRRQNPLGSSLGFMTVMKVQLYKL